MSWLEVIHVRANQREREQCKVDVQHLIAEARLECVCRDLKVYTRVLVDTDLCIHLMHDTPQVENNGSSLGLRIVSALKKFGMVNHTVWRGMRCT